MTRLWRATLEAGRLWLFFMATYLASSHAAGDDLPNTNDIVRTMKSTEDRAGEISVDDLKERLVLQYHALFADADDSRLAALRHSANSGIALQSAWQSLRRQAPAVEQAAPEKLDESSIGRFIGFVDGRLLVTPPSFWIKSLCGSVHAPLPKRILLMCNERSKTVANSGSEKNPGYRELKIDGDWVVSHHALKLSRTKDTVFLDTGSVATTLPDGLLNKIKAEYDLSVGIAFEAVPISPTIILLGVYDSLGSAYPIYCIDKATNKTIWKANVWCEGPPYTAKTGMFFHRMEPIVSGEVLYIFGISTYTAYIEAFSINSGEADFRFSTSY